MNNSVSESLQSRRTRTATPITDISLKRPHRLPDPERATADDWSSPGIKNDFPHVNVGILNGCRRTPHGSIHLIKNHWHPSRVSSLGPPSPDSCHVTFACDFGLSAGVKVPRDCDVPVLSGTIVLIVSPGCACPTLTVLKTHLDLRVTHITCVSPAICPGSRGTSVLVVAPVVIGATLETARGFRIIRQSIASHRVRTEEINHVDWVPPHTQSHSPGSRDPPTPLATSRPPGWGARPEPMARAGRDCTASSSSERRRLRPPPRLGRPDARGTRGAGLQVLWELPAEGSA